MPGPPVWDIPTRLFHWLLALGFAGAWITHQIDEMDWHAWCGYGVLVLLLFRLGWGIVGGYHSRFINFLGRPRHIVSYLRGHYPRTDGHNPLGVLSVIALLLLLLVQALTGLFNSDGLGFSGPLYPAVEGSLADKLGDLHSLLSEVLLALVGLHIVAVLFYQFVRKERLIQGMTAGEPQKAESVNASPAWWKAIVCLLVALMVVGAILYLAPEPVEEFFYY